MMFIAMTNVNDNITWAVLTYLRGVVSSFDVGGVKRVKCAVGANNKGHQRSVLSDGLGMI